MKTKLTLQRNGGPVLLAKKSNEGSLTHCKTRAKLEGNNQPGALIRTQMGESPTVFGYSTKPVFTQLYISVNPDPT